MTQFKDLIAQIQAKPDAPDAPQQLLQLYLRPDLTAETRQQMRDAAAVPAVCAAYENLYFNGVGMDAPVQFVRQTLASASLTRGFSTPAVADEIISELRVFAQHHGVDLPAELAAIRALPGARRVRPWRQFLLLNVLLAGVLIAGTVLAAQTLLPAIVQIGVLAVVVTAQAGLLYRFYQR